MTKTAARTADNAIYRVSLDSPPWEAWVETLREAASLLGPAAQSRSVSRVTRNPNGSFAGLEPLDHAEVEALIALIGGNE